jgi:hypothetical protein
MFASFVKIIVLNAKMNQFVLRAKKIFGIMFSKRHALAHVLKELTMI